MTDASRSRFARSRKQLPGSPAVEGAWRWRRCPQCDTVAAASQFKPERRRDGDRGKLPTCPFCHHQGADFPLVSQDERFRRPPA